MAADRERRATTLDLSDIPEGTTHVATVNGFKWFVKFRDKSFWILPSKQYGAAYQFCSLFIDNDGMVVPISTAVLSAKAKEQQPPKAQVALWFEGGVLQASLANIPVTIRIYDADNCHDEGMEKYDAENDWNQLKTNYMLVDQCIDVIWKNITE